MLDIKQNKMDDFYIHFYYAIKRNQSVNTLTDKYQG